MPALAQCNPGRADDYVTYRHAGWENANYPLIDGIHSSILNYDPWVSGASSFAYAWVMLLNASRYAWAQIG